MSDERAIPGQTAVFNVMKHIARYNLALQFCDHRRVLDAACGVGYGTHLISQVAIDVVGWDIDRPTIDYARETYGRPNSSFYDLDIEKFDKEAPNSIGLVNPIDTLVCFETLEHLFDPELFLSKVRSVMSRKAFIVASVPLNEPQGWNEHHRHIYTIPEAQHLFRGFAKSAEIVQRDLSFIPTTDPQAKQLYSYYIFIGQIS